MFIPYLIAGSSILIGYALGHFTQEELKQGTIYFHVLCLLSLTFMLSISFFLFPLSLLPLFIGAVAGYFLPYPLIYTGFLLNHTLLSKQVFFLLSSLTFVYGLARGSLFYVTNTLFAAFLTFAIFLISFAFPFSSVTLISFLTGTLISCSIKELPHVIPHRHRPQ